MSLLLNSVTASSQWDIDPRSFPDCAIWFDAADTRTITGTSPVTAWANKGSISMSATNDVGTCTSGSGTINGRNFISCPQGTNLQFTCALTSQPRSIFLVVRGQQQLTTNFFAPLTRGTASTTQMAILFSRASATSYHYNVGLAAWTTVRLNAQCAYQSTPGGVSRVSNPVPNFLNTTRVYGFVNSDSATTENYITINGSEYKISTTPTTLTTNTLASGYDTASIKYSINTSDTSATYNTGMDVCEIIYYNRAVTIAERKAIEGYLAWKWGIAKNEPTFTPLSVSNCLAWYDADVDFNDATSRATSFTFSSGNSVQTWIDKSGNGNTATSASATRGVLTQNVWNGKCAWVAGGGATTTLTSTLSLGTTQSFTVFAVASSGSGLSQRAVLTINGYPGTTGGYMSFQQNNAAPAIWQWTGGTGFAGFTTGVPLGGTTRPDLISAVWSPGSCQYTVNGLAQPTSSTTPTALTSSAQMIISGLASGTTIANSWGGNIFEIIVYDGVLSEDNRSSVEEYLSNKWNISYYMNRLVSYHPNRFWRSFNIPYLPIYNSSMANFEIWFDAADLSTITGTSQVTNWVNKGSYGGSATNRTGSCTSGNTFNGLNYISIPAGTDLGFTYAGARAWYIVARVNTVLASGDSFAIIERTTSTTSQTLRGIYASPTTTRFGVGRGAISLAGGFLTSADVTSSSLNSTFVAFVPVQGNVQISVNGTLQTLVNSSSSTYDSTALTFTIGRNQYNTSIDVMELIGFSNLTLSERQQIEGYLAWKWGLQTLLPSTHRFPATSMPPNTPSTLPFHFNAESGSSIPSAIFLWLDASDPDGTGVLPTTGSAIRQWVDKSGYARTVSQTTASQCPVFTTDDGYPAIQFTSSSSQFLQSSESLNPSGTWAACTIYVVCKPTSLAADSVVFFNTMNPLTNTSTNSVYREVDGSLSGNNGFQLRYNTTTTKTASTAGTTTKMILCISDPGSSSTNPPNFYKNGTSLATTLVGATSLTIADTGRSVVGARCFSSTFSAFFTGFIYEILVVRIQQITYPRQQIEGYLAWKWGLQTSLPTTHPFYKIRP
jgi:hypothetical protein